MGVDYRNPEGYVDPVPYQAISNMDKEQKRYMPMVYICSAYSGDVEYNVQKARTYSRYAVDVGAIPIAPHLYTNTILKPLIPTKYTGNAILDILLSDKVRQTENSEISFIIDLGGISFDFMEAIDITTVFGNLLDNALESCESIQDRKDKEIVLTAERFQEIVSVTIKNDCNPVKWRSGMPISEKGENRGIGLLNVRKSIDKYDGNLKLRENEGKFIAEFFLNT